MLFEIEGFFQGLVEGFFLFFLVELVLGLLVELFHDGELVG